MAFDQLQSDVSKLARHLDNKIKRLSFEGMPTDLEELQYIYSFFVQLGALTLENVEECASEQEKAAALEKNWEILAEYPLIRRS